MSIPTWEILGRPPVPPGLPDLSILSKQAAAWQRALPYTRLTDYGMDPADARELLWRTAEDEGWTAVACEIGERQLDRSRRAKREQRNATAQVAARAAAAAFNAGQVALNFDTEQKRAVYGSFQQSVRELAELSNGWLHAVEIGSVAGPVSGWLARPAAPSRATVIVWGGLSGWGASYLNLAVALNQRGLACLMAEGPGQGNSRLIHGVTASDNVLRGFTSFVDYIAAHPELPGPIGIQGNSFGGLIAARVASSDERVRACVINGAGSQPIVPDFRSAREQILAFFGAESDDAARAGMERLWYDPAAHPLTVPTLVLRGGADPLVRPEEQEPFVTGAGHTESRLLTWPDGEHTLYNHAQERDAVTADWFNHHLTT